MLRKSKSFPEPLGPYLVGLTERSFADDSRTGMFPFAPNEARNIPVQFYYPADEAQGKPRVTYSFPEEAERFKKESRGLVSARYQFMNTPCYRDLPVSASRSRYPVIFFNHGYNGHMMQNVVLCCDLASRGYIVASIGHPYESGAVRYPDGKVILADEPLSRTVNQELRANMPAFREMKQRKFSDKEIFPAVASFFAPIKSTKVWQHVRIWADDNLRVADRLEALNQAAEDEFPFAGRLDLKRGFGITGHSYGGCTAGQVCLDDPRFVCGVNMDAPTYGEYWDRDLKKPFMILGSELMELLARPLFLSNSADAYLIIVEDTQHMDYTDMIHYAPQLKLLKMLGKRDKALMREVVSFYHLAFFDRYLASGNPPGDDSPLSREDASGEKVPLAFEGVRVRMRRAASEH